MFYCPPCQLKNRWPESLARSRGECEICGTTAVCYDVPSSRLPLLPAEPVVEHRLHVEQGPEYQGETYIWCECLAGKENLVQGGSAQTPAGALFEAMGVTSLLEFLELHIPGVSVEDKVIAGSHFECLFEKNGDPHDRCRQPADSAVTLPDGSFSYRCLSHRYWISEIKRGNLVWAIPMTVPLKKIVIK
jgi:hypothetical protein